MAIHWSTRGGDARLNRWIGSLFAIGSLCFLLGPFPGFVQLIGSEADGIVFFVGSVFFTAAAALQALQSTGGDRIPTLIQFAGTIFFNVDTFRALKVSLDDPAVDRLVWAPEAVGAACFLVSGLIAYRSVQVAGHARRRNAEWRLAAVNLAGCILFAISAAAAFVVPSTGDVLDLAAANATTVLGAACFLVGALMLIPRRSSSPAAVPATR